MSLPITPQPAHADLPGIQNFAIGQFQSHHVSNATGGSMTPPPSIQVAAGPKSRTPTPTDSHISTPPPTVGTNSHGINGAASTMYARTMTTDQIESASPEELRTRVAELQAAYQEAKMTAAHHKLQYQMLAQESAAAIERMAVEARMTQFEDEVIHIAEQAKAAVTPARPPMLQEGTIPVQKDLYQRMCREIQQLSESNSYLEAEHRQQEKLVMRQENEIASLTDKVSLMRDRIRENREHQNRYRSASVGRQIEGTPRSVYSTPRRPHLAPKEQTQNFAALLQASEMASQEAGASRQASGRGAANKKGHTRNIHSMSSLPVTPSRTQKQPPLFSTPSGRQQPLKVPSTAPVQRTSAMRNANVYSQQALPFPGTQGAQSDGTVSASDNDDNDSEAETDIIEPDEINESQASRAASQMLRSSQEQQSQRESFSGCGMLQQQPKTSNMRQSKLFGAVRKPNLVRAGEDERPAKRKRTGEGIGLGIAGVRQ